MQQSSVTNSDQAWKNYWHELHTLALANPKLSGSIWDWDPAITGAADLERFHTYFNPKLPLIDLGCGKGNQTRYLATHFPNTIGVDVSADAIALARDEGGAHFEILNALMPTDIEIFHHRHGDANVYMRGVLHCIDKEKQQILTNNVSQLLGKSGVLYLLGPSTEMMNYVQQLAQQYGAMPYQLGLVMKHKIDIRGINEAIISGLFPSDRFEILTHGNTYYEEKQVALTPDGKQTIPFRPPLYFSIICKK